MLWYEVGFRAASECEGVDEEEGEYDHHGAEDTPPKTFVHECFGLLFAIDEVFHGEVERGKRPNVERCQSCGER